ncbi:MAG: hypothetical protein ACJKTH_00415 [Patescibacteria group bacterium UBA2163]
MLNIVSFSGDSSAIENLKDNPLGLGDLFSHEVLSQLQAVRDMNSDNIIIRNVPTPFAFDETPQKIHGSIPDIFPKYLIEILGSYFGEISEKMVENSIRFVVDEKGATNVETWHGHPQFSFSIFYCLRGDKNAKTYFLSAHDIMAQAGEEKRGMLLASGLLKQVEGGYEFSKELYQPSDFQQYIENLDLPDTTKSLNMNKEDEAFRYLLRCMVDAEESIVYQSGDVAVYNERQTMRFSPSYIPSTKDGEGRWLLGVGVRV